ncbi:leucine--tRNA ligase [Buchnera aphidicola (Nipponaphis monzeni)]|uniref:Leucine--tRNA ligase n=1 Tax=Buchnera aphidicola (Nipponaphis monzeni) TaxID=2495405 RepID=A0A455TAL2_9GAMM|nr:leucine--tRNA ligase [Buchnera aphidicola]BBI01340.1 leucine--tRNA ligase [Buchnera aphidicola (Nipponaphis monzeni)]
MEKTYHHKKIELYVQNHWDKHKSFKVKEDFSKKKYYCLSMLPYPSGKLHMGHVRNYTIGDVIARYQRMLGKNVLHPIGWDAFGLPAEEAAIQNNITPSEWTYKNIKYMKEQLKSLGLSYDWTREIITCKPEFYRWEQWFFIQLYKRKMVYKKKSSVNWCPQDNIVLANEQVVNGSCWRCDTKVIKKNIPQWFIKISDYAEQLLEDLKILKYWPKKVKDMQKNWIGKSSGVEFELNVFNSNQKILIFTTRPDCIMGATFVSISPFHLFAKKLSKKNNKIKQFIEKYTYQLTHLTNIQDIKNKGKNTKKFAIHPITKTLLPIWIANFVIPDYGSGAIISVPAHNVNDWNFAIAQKLKIKPVILCLDGSKPHINKQPMIEKGNLFNSGKLLNGLSNVQGNTILIQHLKKNNKLKKKIYFKIKDWNVSRQRYWGTPIPIAKLTNKQFIEIPEEKLPIILPENIPIKELYNSNYKYNSPTNIINIHGNKLICETDTFDTFMESSWYYLRYTNPHFNSGMIDPEASKYWLPIDCYIGGIEHAVMHLLYFRYIHKILKNFNLVSTNEPVKKLICQGMVVSDAYYYKNNNKKIWVSPENVCTSYDHIEKANYIYDKKSKNKVLYAGKIKMSKSKKNGIEPKTIIEHYGADALRLFILFAAPPESALEWKEDGVKGTYRFLNKLWNMTFNFLKNSINITNTKQLKYIDSKKQHILYELNKTIIKVSDAINKNQSFNTAISSIFKFFNVIKKVNIKDVENYFIIKKSLLTILKMMYPFTPHFSHVLLSHLKNTKKITEHEKWPIPNLQFVKKKYYTIIVQINGKTRHVFDVKSQISKNETILIAKNNIKISKYLNSHVIKRIIYIPNKLINFVIV